MPVGISVRIEGLDRALGALDRWGAIELRRRSRQGIRAGAGILRTPMKREAPKRTGALARSVTVVANRDGSASVGPRIRYRHFVIRGTRRGVRPNPFVDRTVDRELDNVKRRVGDVILRGRR